MRAKIENMGYFWSQIKEDIQKYISTCYNCQTMKNVRVNSTNLFFKKIWKSPNQCIVIDYTEIPYNIKKVFTEHKQYDCLLNII
jgi:hypothetical protein